MSSRYNPPSVSDAAYDATAWDGVTSIAPSKGAVRDKLEGLQDVYALLAPSSVSVAGSSTVTLTASQVQPVVTLTGATQAVAVVFPASSAALVHNSTNYDLTLKKSGSSTGVVLLSGASAEVVA